MLGEVTHSMLFILCSPDLRGGRSVLTRHLSSGLHMLYVNMMKYRSCEGGYVICVPINFISFIFESGQMCA